MALNANKLTKRIVSQLDSIGIESKVGDGPSHTAELVRLIVEGVITEIITNGNVLIVNVPVQTIGTPTNHSGFANGLGSIV